VSDGWSKGHSEVHSFLTSGPLARKRIPSDSLSLTLSFFQAQTHKSDADQSEKKERNRVDLRSDPLLLVVISECVLNIFFASLSTVARCFKIY